MQHSLSRSIKQTCETGGRWKCLNTGKRRGDGGSVLTKEDFRITDAEAIRMIKEACGVDSNIAGMDITKRNQYIKKLRELGLSIRQISRVTGISKGSIEKIK